jgi:hypothetical protein
MRSRIARRPPLTLKNLVIHTYRIVGYVFQDQRPIVLEFRPGVGFKLKIPFP